MTIENDVLQTIAEALQGIQSELKTLNRHMAQKSGPTKPEASYGAPARSEYRPQRGGPGPRGTGRSGPSKFGKGKPSESPGSKSFKGKTDKPPRKPN